MEELAGIAVNLRVFVFLPRLRLRPRVVVRWETMRRLQLVELQERTYEKVSGASEEAYNVVWSTGAKDT